MNQKEKERQAAIARLRELLKPGDTVRTVLRHVSRSGMSRSISTLILHTDGSADVSDYSGLVARALGWPFDEKHGGVKVAGCGMDMGFHLVYSLSYTLFPAGYTCSGKSCQSSEHTRTHSDPPPEGTCLDHIKREQGVCHDPACKPWIHKDGGYALKHRWI
jgi:hypothetical protein